VIFVRPLRYILFQTARQAATQRVHAWILDRMSPLSPTLRTIRACLVPTKNVIPATTVLQNVQAGMPSYRLPARSPVSPILALARQNGAGSHGASLMQITATGRTTLRWHIQVCTIAMRRVDLEIHSSPKHLQIYCGNSESHFQTIQGQDTHSLRTIMGIEVDRMCPSCAKYHLSTTSHGKCET
jgi:hypothetical protein